MMTIYAAVAALTVAGMLAASWEWTPSGPRVEQHAYTRAELGQTWAVVTAGFWY
jgi:hypothetical protein